MDILSEESEESQALKNVLGAYANYEVFATKEYYEPRLKKWESLSHRQRTMVPWYENYLRTLLGCIKCNANFLKDVVSFATSSMQIESFLPSLVDGDMEEKTVSMLTQLCREWSAECEPERKLLLNRLLPFLASKFQIPSKVKILIPGAGTGRLMLDLVKAGFVCEGNEYSYHMLVMSIYMLNSGLRKNEVTIFPFIHTFSHWKDRENHLRAVKIPDVNIEMSPSGSGQMSMSAGSFVDCYGSNQHTKSSMSYSSSPTMRLTRAKMQESFTVVVTNFFIDTAPNILDYVETIKHVLVRGGLWINFGPLLYHFENVNQVETISKFDPHTGLEEDIMNDVPMKGLELTAEEILAVATEFMKFTTLRKEFGIISGYGGNPDINSVLGYHCNFWILENEKSAEKID